MKALFSGVTNLKLVTFGLILYGLIDLLIPYNSTTPLLAISLVGVILPLFILHLTRNSLSILHSLAVYIVFFALVKLFFVFGPKFTNYSDGKTSISYGTYIGLSPQSVNLRLLFIVVLVIAFAIYFAWADVRRGSEAKNKLNDLVTHDSQIQKLGLSNFWIVLVAVAITTPFLEGQVQGLAQVTSALDFDSQQINAWFDFKSQGFIEMRDFWFPYGGMIWVQDGLLGIILRWLLLSSLVVMLVNYFWNQFRYFKTESSYLIIAVLLIVNFPIISIRYVFPLMSLLLFFNLRQLESKKAKLMKSIPLAIAIWMSPEMSIFVIGLSIFGFILKRTSRMEKSYDRSLQIWIVPLFSFLLLVFSQAQKGQIKNTLSLLANSREILEYSFTPNLAFIFNLSSDYLTLFRLSIVMLSLMVLTRATSNLFIFAKKSQISSHTLNQFFIGVYLLFLIQKEMSRGGMTLWVAILIGLAIVLLLENGEKKVFILQNESKSNKVISETLRAMSILTVLSVLFVTPVGAGTFTTVLRAPQQAKTFLGDLYQNQPSNNIFHASWDLENQKKLIELKNQFGPYFQKLLDDMPFVLGDRPDIYRALGKDPYWAISQYNLSPKSAQVKVLDEIMTRNPKYVLVDRSVSAQNFDNFPSSLRNPIVYRYIIENYRYLSTFGDMDLYQNAPGSRNFTSWTNLLGNDLDISALPLAVSPPFDCIAYTSADCKFYLKFRLDTINNLELKFNCYGTNYFLISSSSMLRRGVEYWFPLDNVWFWNKNCTIDRTPGLEAKLLKKLKNNDLY